ncbi:chemotaxis protein CheX [Nibricoccus sp. IMCC34717]|uniref:chemotaxis protein CheX n=1 Tax=Nibricoccus sp. IMCC34717 TaxID=3034021 RepID=UPI00384D93A2
MPTIDQISETVFRETISRAVQDVFKTMLGRTATLANSTEVATADGSPWEHPVQIEGQHVVGTVGFIGDISGLIYLYLEDGFANVVASHMLGMTLEEIDEAGHEVVNDAVGELTNMTVGTFKNQLADKGFPCKLTIPSILRGSNFSIEPVSSATRRIYRFQVGDHHIVTDLLMKSGDNGS